MDFDPRDYDQKRGRYGLDRERGSRDSSDDDRDWDDYDGHPDRSVSRGVDTTDLTADAGSANDDGNLFRYDATSQQYVYNLSTAGWSAPGTYRIFAASMTGRSTRWTFRCDSRLGTAVLTSCVCSRYAGIVNSSCGQQRRNVNAVGLANEFWRRFSWYRRC